MPVEIKELIIRAVTTAEPAEDEAAPLRAAQDQDAIIQECVRQVLRILKKMKER